MLSARVATGLALAAASATLGAPADAAAPGSAAQDDRYTPLIQSVISTPHWFRDAEGRTRH